APASFSRSAAARPGAGARLHRGRRRLGEGRRLQHELLAHGAAAAHAPDRPIRRASASARGRSRIQPARSRLRRVPYTVRDARQLTRRAPRAGRSGPTRREKTMTRYARVALAVIFVGLLMTPFLVRRFSQPASPIATSGHVDALKQYGFRLTESAKAAGL